MDEKETKLFRICLFKDFEKFELYNDCLTGFELIKVLSLNSTKPVGEKDSFLAILSNRYTGEARQVIVNLISSKLNTKSKRSSSRDVLFENLDFYYSYRDESIVHTTGVITNAIDYAIYAIIKDTNFTLTNSGVVDTLYILNLTNFTRPAFKIKGYFYNKLLVSNDDDVITFRKLNNVRHALSSHGYYYDKEGKTLWLKRVRLFLDKEEDSLSNPYYWIINTHYPSFINQTFLQLSLQSLSS